MQLMITIEDPDTILLLQKYRRFIAQEDAVDGSMDEIAEGLILGLLDEHRRFASWCKENPTVHRSGDLVCAPTLTVVEPSQESTFFRAAHG